MTQFVIRSMSTTDASFRKGAPPPTPYHVYLLPRDQRISAWWTPVLSLAMRFDSAEAAQQEIVASGLDRPYGSPDVVPYDHSHLPTYWEVRASRRVKTEG